MILFCEECGKKNQLETSWRILLTEGFACVHCNFLTPPSTLNGYIKNPDSHGEIINNTDIVCSTSRIQFGQSSSDQPLKLPLSFKSRSGANCNMIVEVIGSLRDDLLVHKVDERHFTVHLLPFNKRMVQTPSFTGSALSCFDAYSDFRCQVEVEFSRNVPQLYGIPDRVDIGNITSGIQYRNYLVAENKGSEILQVQLKPEPEDFSIAARFVIDSSLAVSVAPRQIKKIPYLLWPIEDISEDWQFSQKIKITTNEPGRNNMKRIVIQGTILAPQR